MSFNETTHCENKAKENKQEMSIYAGSSNVFKEKTFL